MPEDPRVVLINIPLILLIRLILTIDTGIPGNNHIITPIGGINKTIAGGTGTLENKLLIICTKDNNKSFIGKLTQGMVLNTTKPSEIEIVTPEVNIILTIKVRKIWKDK